MAGNARKYELTIFLPDDENADDVVGYNIYVSPTGTGKPTGILTSAFPNSDPESGLLPDEVKVSLIDYLHDQKDNNPNFEREGYDIRVYSVDAVGNESEEAYLLEDVRFDITPPPKPRMVKLS